MAALENLPEDLVIEILSRLPPESLLRFKSVCKSWYALINHPKVVTKHLSNSLHRHNHNHFLLKRVVKDNNGDEENIFSILNFPIPIDDVSESVFDFPYCDKNFEHFHICGHSHGLICLYDEEEIFLFNPTTREIRKLPPSILHLTKPRENDLESQTDAVGFGFDPKSKDFKVVRMVYFIEGPEFALLPLGVEIYDLSKDRWREIVSDVKVRPAISAPLLEMHHQGIYYWWAQVKEEGWANIIQTFDMSGEVFGRIDMPDVEIQEQGLERRSLAILNGSIVLITYVEGLEENIFDVWEMEKNDESGGGVSWSKLFTIDPVTWIENPILFVNSEELLMETSEGRLILYNIRTQEFKELPIRGNRGTFQATFLIRSLVSVKGGGSNGF